MFSPDQLSSGDWQFGVYGQRMERKPVLELHGSSSFGVPLSRGGTAEIFSDETSEVEMEADSGSVMALLAFRPREGLTYFAKAGRVESFDVSYSSGSWVNSLVSTDGGWVWGVGLRINCSQVTAVSPGISLDVSYTNTRIDLNRFESNGAQSVVSQRWIDHEYQGALSYSRRFKWFEPYVGAKVFYLVSELSDRQTGSELKGEHEGISPFIGLKIEPFDREYFLLEVAFVDEKSINAGAAIRF